MGYFTKNEPGSASHDRLPRLSTELICAVLDSWEAHYLVDDDGDPGGFWDGHMFYFMRAGREETVLTVRARWNRTLSAEHLDAVARLLNAWHCDAIWPKGYVQVEDGALGVYGDVSVSLGEGVTQAQLDDLMGCGLATNLQLFEHLDEHFPEAAADADAEFGAASGAGPDAGSQADAD